MADDFNYQDFNKTLFNLNSRGNDGQEDKYEEVSNESDNEYLNEKEKLTKAQDKATRLE